MNKAIPTLSVILALGLSLQATQASEEFKESKKSHGCKEVQKIFKGKYKCNEIGDFHDGAERKNNGESKIHPVVTPAKEDENPKQINEKQESNNSSQNKEKNEQKK